MATSSAPGGLPPPQLSPWAVRFGRYGFSDLFKQGEIHHSGLAPEFPRLDPRYYLESQDKNKLIARPGSDEDIDRLFLSEDYQRTVFNLMLTWEVTILNKWVNFGPKFGTIDGGHMAGDMLRIPGTVWTATQPDNQSLLQKGRFDPSLRRMGEDFETEFALRIFELESLKVDETKWFTFLRRERWYNSKTHRVDDDDVWNAVRPSLELVDRVLKAAILEQHEALQTLLYGRYDYWATFDPNNPSPPHEAVLLSLAEERRLTKMLGMPQPCNGEFMTKLGPADWTDRLEYLATWIYWYIYEPSGLNNFTSTESGVTQHAGNGSLSIGVNGLPLRSLVNRVGGKRVRLTLSERCLITFSAASTMIHELAHALTCQRYQTDDTSMGVFVVPDSAVKEPAVNLFASQAPEMGFWIEHQMFGGIIDMKRAFVEASMNIPLSVESAPYADDTVTHRRISVTGTAEYNLLSKEHCNRTRMWDSLRQGWFADIQKERAQTIWNESWMRELIANIPILFAQRDEIGCAKTAGDLVDHMPWHDPVAFVNTIPANGWTHNSWYYHALGLLLMAAMPIRTARMERPNPVVQIKLEAGKEALSAGVDAKMTLVKYGLPVNSEIPVIGSFCGESEFYDTWNGGAKKTTKPITQRDYLDAVRKLLTRVGDNGVVVEKQWLDRLYQAGKYIQDARRSLRPHEWVVQWPFREPPYALPVWVQWNKQSQSWKTL
ncbi:hypothetical protein F5Y16DRAFT_416235 [Xylariaceae sp. FL0255]|nr:hypothetical protein F5Y16DRAFT_416235 [Xylariaceae sp. FL0255]